MSRIRDNRLVLNSNTLFFGTVSIWLGPQVWVVQVVYNYLNCFVNSVINFCFPSSSWNVGVEDASMDASKQLWENFVILGILLNLSDMRGVFFYMWL